MYTNFKSTIIVIALIFSTASASLAQNDSNNLFKLFLDTSVTYDNIVAKFGEPNDIGGNEGESRRLYYNVNKANEYMYGWMIIEVNAKNKFCGYQLKVKDQYTSTKITLDEFKSKFQLSDDIVNLFYMNEKNLKSLFNSKGYSLEKQEEGLDYLDEYAVKGIPSSYSYIIIQIGRGKGYEKSKNDEFSRQDKVYQLAVHYSNAFDK